MDVKYLLNSLKKKLHPETQKIIFIFVLYLYWNICDVLNDSSANLLVGAEFTLFPCEVSDHLQQWCHILYFLIDEKVSAALSIRGHSQVWCLLLKTKEQVVLMVILSWKLKVWNLICLGWVYRREGEWAEMKQGLNLTSTTISR